MTDHQSTPSYDELLQQMRDIALVVTSVANGDLTRKMTVEATGEMLELKKTINTMVDQLNVFAAEATRISREVGTEGLFGGQMEVKGVTGVWRNLTDDLNLMSRNLTNQMRNIALVTTNVANGDLSRKMTVDAEGEMLELKNTINVMIDQLMVFHSEGMRLTRELGTEGVLGGHIKVRGVSGSWKDLIDNLNLMSDLLTVQVRSLNDTVQAAIAGDTSRRITVEAQGEMKELRDALNLLIERSAHTTE